MDSLDSQLLEKYTSGNDEACFAQLVSRHQRMVYGACLRVLGNSTDAEDVTQAVFLVMLAKHKSLRKRTSFAGWLYAAAARMAKDERRRTIRRNVRETKAMENIADDQRRQRELKERFKFVVGPALAKLPEKYRNPLVLHYVEGVPQQSVAEQLGATPSAVYSLLSRGRDMLRKEIGKAGGIAVSAGEMTPMLAEKAAPSAKLMSAVSRNASLVLSKSSAMSSSTFSPKVISIYHEAMKTMFKTQLLTLSVGTAAVFAVTSLVTLAVDKPWTSSERGMSAAVERNAEMDPEARRSAVSPYSNGGRSNTDRKKLQIAQMKTGSMADKRENTDASDTSRKVDWKRLNTNFERKREKRERKAAKRLTWRPCVNNLKRIGVALMDYTRKHDGKLPPDGYAGLEPLRPYMSGTDILICPESGKTPAEKGAPISEANCDFVYRPPVKKMSDAKNPSQTPIAWHVHDRNDQGVPDYIMVLFMDGHAQNFRDPDVVLERFGIKID